MFKRMISIALSSIMLISTLGISFVAVADNTFDGGARMVNPIKEYATFDELQKSVDFTIEKPVVLPKGYKMSDYSTISGDMAQISYVDNEENSITYRAMPTRKMKDISGDYNIYKKESTLTYDDCTVTLKGSRIAAKQATWFKDGISYSLSLDIGVQWATIETIMDAMLMSTE